MFLVKPFCFPSKGRKEKYQVEVEAGKKSTSSPHSNVDTIKVSATTTADCQLSETGQKKKTKPWWHLSSLFRRKNETPESPPVTEDGEEKSQSSQTTQIESNDNSSSPDSILDDDHLFSEVNFFGTSKPSGHGGSLKSVPGTISPLPSVRSLEATAKTLSGEDLVCLGFPNLGQTCYMNSTLQGLLTLNPFVQEVHNQEQVWRSHPKCQLIRGFVEVGVCHFSGNMVEKEMVLANFKDAVADLNTEFEDDSQMDAHEFLTCVLDELRSLSVDLHLEAAMMGAIYTCPVEAHMAFEMLSTRTCKGCGSQSFTTEDYTNLSLSLVNGGSVSQSLQEYLKETELEYLCSCGAADSSLQKSFLTVPNVLIIQLQRFGFTRSFTLKKEKKPICLSRELAVNLDFEANRKTHYSLVSIISHLGNSADHGHYVCDGAHRQQGPRDTTDRWLTYNDSDVTVTTGESVCHQRQKTAYLLFYEKQE